MILLYSLKLGLWPRMRSLKQDFVSDKKECCISQDSLKAQTCYIGLQNAVQIRYSSNSCVTQVENPVVPWSTAGCSSRPNTVLKARGIFQELLAFNTQWKSEEADSNISEWMPQEEDKRICQREWRQANKKTVSFFLSFYLICHQKVSSTSKVGLPSSDNLIKKVPNRGASLLHFSRF